MKILMAASEVWPFAKTGGLADVSGTLPKFLAKAGHDVRVVMPLYRTRIDRSQLTALPGALGVPMGVLGEHWAEVYVGQLPGSEVPVYFIDYAEYFARDGIYNNARGQGYSDNDHRFVFLSRAALQLCYKLSWLPDIVHANDWHTAILPVFLNTVYRNTPLAKVASLLTIHNMQYQGDCHAGLMNVLGVDWRHFNHLELECYHRVNLLKGGLYHATLINTVSQGYTEEIKTPAFGHGLNGVVRERGRSVSGILNGIDYSEWDPTHDPYIAANYTAEDLSGKAVCKAALQQEMGLPLRPDVPLVGLVSRLVFQKGLDVFAGVVDALCRDLDVQFALLGSGEPWAHHFFSAAARRWPKRFAAHIGYDNPLAHRIEAGADMFLMPSRFEPCGLNQLYSLRYGTLPIVRAVGGLRDTVERFDPEKGTGTGFTFNHLSDRALYHTVVYAVRTFMEQPRAMADMVQRGMALRFSWEDATQRYVALYEDATRRRTWA